MLALQRRVVRPMSPCSSGNSPTISVTRSALASMRGALGLGGSAPVTLAQLLRQRRDALDALVLRAELLVEDDVAP